LFPLERKEEQLVAEALITVFSRMGFGPPTILHSDNGHEFCNSVILQLKK